MKTATWAGETNAMKMTKTIKRVLVSLCCVVFGLMMGLIVCVNAPLTAKAEAVKTTDVMYCDGASIRLNADGNNGIRFHVRTTADENGNVVLDGVTYSGDEFKALETGILLIPSNKLASNEQLTIEGVTNKYASGAKAANVTGDDCIWNFRSETVGEVINYYYEATAYIYNIPEESYDKEFTFRGYYCVDGEYTYTVNENNQRSVSYVALQVKADGYNGEFETQLNGFLPQRVEISKNFTNKTYIYRVGNQDAVALSSLFEVADDVVVDTDETAATTISFSSSTGVTANYSAGKVQFEGTGLVTVTLQDEYSRNNVKTLTLEVVDAYNVTSYSQLKRQQKSVLLNDIKMGATALWFDDATLYGNGFTFDVRDALYTGVDYDYNSYVIALVNSTLDNVKIIGKVYPKLGGTKSEDYNRALVLSSENSRIVNCYLANCASPVRSTDNLEIVNTTLAGGIYANLDFRAGTLLLDNVTTINQSSSNEKADNGETIVGLGIATYVEGGDAGMTITIKNALTQYNYISKNDQANLKNTYTQTITETMFSSDFSAYQYTENGETWVNAGILSMNDYFQAGDIIDERTNAHGYTGMSKTVTVSLVKKNCYVYTFKPTSISNPSDYVTAGQGVIAPNYDFDYTKKNYIAKTENSNDYCYQADGIVYISMDEGETFNWDTSILTVGKAGQTLDYTVSMNKTDYTGRSITFNTAGDYEVAYTYTDEYNYNADGSRYEVTYTKIVKINVVVVERAAQHAVFSFGTGGTAYTAKTVMVGDKTYVMPDVSAEVSGKIGKTTVNGTTVYYPITEMYTSDGKTSHSGTWYACFPIFKDALQIIDYADGGTGAAVTYNQSTVTTVAQIPSTLKATNPTSAFLYQMNAGSYPPPTTPSAVKSAVCYTCNKSGLSSSNTRTEMTITAEYTYTDNAGTVYYYYIGYHCAEQTKGSGGCVTPDTLVTLADGTQKEIQSVTYSDMLLVWDFYNGEYIAMPSSIVMNHGYDNYTVLSLTFDDGTVVNTINGHGFFDKDENKFVILDENNVAQYIGHNFVKEDVNTTTKLISYSVREEYTESWSILTAGHYNCVMGGMLTITPAEVEGSTNYLMPFELGEDMKYDEAKLQADIDTYGLYTYADFTEYMTYEQYEALNLANFKVAVGKGYITWDEILYLISIHIG